jgi:nitrite transporter NirC
MFLETVDQFAKTAVAKAAYLKRSPGGFFISSMLAGAYVGLGIILIFNVGSKSIRGSGRWRWAPRSRSPSPW